MIAILKSGELKMTKLEKKNHVVRQMMANRFDAANFDLNSYIVQKDACIKQIKTYGRKFPQTIAKRELILMFRLMFPRNKVFIP
jgi:hypothetical protein